MRALFKGGHKVVEYIEPGGAAERNGSLEVGDVIMGVDGIPAEKLSVADMESMLTGQAGTLVRVLVCNGRELQAHADQVGFVCGREEQQRRGVMRSVIVRDSLQRPRAAGALGLLACV